MCTMQASRSSACTHTPCRHEGSRHLPQWPLLCFKPAAAVLVGTCLPAHPSHLRRRQPARSGRGDITASYGRPAGLEFGGPSGSSSRFAAAHGGTGPRPACGGGLHVGCVLHGPVAVGQLASMWWWRHMSGAHAAKRRGDGVACSRCLGAECPVCRAASIPSATDHNTT